MGEIIQLNHENFFRLHIYLTHSKSDFNFLYLSLREKNP